MPIPKHQKPRYAKATANSCLLSGARTANTSEIAPPTRKSIELEKTSTTYSDGVGFFKGRENINRVTPPKLEFRLQLAIYFRLHRRSLPGETAGRQRDSETETRPPKKRKKLYVIFTSPWVDLRAHSLIGHRALQVLAV